MSGKIRGARAKAMKFVDGFMVHSGEPYRVCVFFPFYIANNCPHPYALLLFVLQQYVDVAVRHVLLRQGVLGLKIKIMLPHDPTGKTGPKTPLPDNVAILDPKEEVLPTEPRTEVKNAAPVVAVAAQ